MQSFNKQLKTVIVPQFLAEAGKRAKDLRPFELALIDCETNLSVDEATFAPDKAYQLVFKTPSKGADNRLFPDQFGTQLPIKSLPISLIDKTHVFDKATDVQKNFVSYLGFDGISDCKGLNFPCGADLAILIKANSHVIRNTFGRNLSQMIPFTTPCCDDCTNDVKQELMADTIIEAIENAPFYINEFMKVEKVLSCCPTRDPFDRKLFKTFKLTVCDNGDSLALARVQGQYPNFTVTRVGRFESDSTYEVCVDCPFSAADQAAIDTAQAAVDALDPSDPNYSAAVSVLEAAQTAASTNAATACMPADYTMTNSRMLKCDECPDCPGSFTKIDPADKVVACFTEPALGGVPTESFSLDYYADQSTAQATIDGLVATLAGNIPSLVADSSSVLSVDCDKVTLEACVTTGTVITEHGVAGMTLTSIGECKGRCEGSVTIPWCVGDDKYKISRTMCLVHKNDECDGDYLEEVKASLAEREDVDQDSIVITKSNGCITEYSLTQCNNECLEDGCDTFGKDGAKFDSLPAFGVALWEACACEGWTFDSDGCPVAPVTDPETCRAGLKFQGAFIGREEIDCSWAIDDLIEREPIELEISIVDANDELGNLCDLYEVPYRVVQFGSYAEGRGDFGFRDEVLSRQYDLYHYVNPNEYMGVRLARALGYEYLFDPAKYYNHISLYHNSRFNRFYDNNEHTRELIKIYVEADNVSLLERLKTFFNKTLLDHGHINLL